MSEPNLKVLPGEMIAYIEHNGTKYVELDWVLKHIVKTAPTQTQEE